MAKFIFYDIGDEKVLGQYKHNMSWWQRLLIRLMPWRYSPVMTIDGVFWIKY